MALKIKKEQFKTVNYSQDESVVIISINRPEVMNSFNAELRSELLLALKKAVLADDIRAIIINGNGRNFSAGADLKDTDDAQKSLEEVLNNEYRPIFNLISDINIPVIASVHGSAAGIGLSLALCCDLMIMSDDAFLLAPFTSISLAPDGGMNWFLVHQLGYRKAFQVCIEAERIDAKYCVEYGLANKCVPAEDLFLETLAWARRIAKRAPLSVTATKKIMRYAASHSWSETYDIEVPTQQKLINSNDFKEGVEAFIKKREPKFNGN
jgi:2-(1,2-epoxy-1,2-dihydrophenyl)acetyl-CoA isomerase